MPDRSPGPAMSPAAMAALANAPFVEDLYEQWKQDPGSVDGQWQMFFQGFELAMCPRACVSGDQARKQSAVASLIYNYRKQGHVLAQVDPLGNNLTHHPDLELGRFGLAEADLDQVFDTGHLGGPKRAPLRDIVNILKETYCGFLGVEYLHIQDVRIRRWLQAAMEPSRNQPNFDRGKKLEILRCLVDAELLETFIQTRYLGQKRFSLEGGESLIPALYAMAELSPELGIDEMVIGMTHRGRLNVLANILRQSYAMLFSEFEGNFIPETVSGDGDVKYHRGYTANYETGAGKQLHISLAANPSHLEAVDPVVEGKTRAKQQLRGLPEGKRKILPLLVHGDAAFAGQGLVAETLNLSQLEGYATGGTVHLLVNNQIGFTTLPRDARSSYYSTDVAKMIEAPVFHVNGDEPEAVVYAVELALRFRQEFGRDVVVDMLCYRRHGHNETDEPMYTQPVLYAKIKDRPTVATSYRQRLIDEGLLSPEEGEEIASDFKARLQQAYEYVKVENPSLEVQAFEALWQGLNNPYTHEPVETGVDHDLLKTVAGVLTSVPGGFSLNPKVAKKLPETLKAVEARGEVDWGFAEALAFGTLVYEGSSVRLSGQDSQRGTFSHRHAVWQDMKTQEPYVPLNHVREGQAPFLVYNSMLSEAAVLGFEYGYSLTEPLALVIWEAQFGDFANGAQVIIDQFIVSSQSKWQRTSGLVLLLPHGYEGQGPEHSNAYLERYLAVCAEENIQVVNLTTPAQYFHVLRRQIKRNFRRPLIVMATKSLFRHPRAVSPVDEMASGVFHEILDDPDAPAKTRRLILCSGKVYYDLLAEREKQEAPDAAMVRVEQFYPLPETQMAGILERYREVEEVFWVQEESKNRGGWSFMFPHLLEWFPDRPVRYVGRPASASPATGSLRLHKAEQAGIVREAFAVS